MLALCVTLFAPAAGGMTLCDSLRAIDHVARQAREAAVPEATPAVRLRYRRDLARLATELAAHDAWAPPAPVRVAAGEALALQRAVASRLAAGDSAAAAAVIASPAWRRSESGIALLARAHGCVAPRAAERGAAERGVAERGAAERGAADRGAPAQDAGGSPAAAWAAAAPGRGVMGGVAPVLGLAVVAVVAALLAWRRRAGAEPLASCFVAGALQGRDYCEGAELVELSRSGCKLRLHERLTPGQPLSVFVGRWRIAARTVWTNAHYAGLRFDRRLSPAHLRAIMQQPKRRPRDSGPMVPSLPCHTETCRQRCPPYLAAQRRKAAAAEATR